MTYKGYNSGYKQGRKDTKKEIIEELELLKKKSTVTVRNEISRKWDIDSSNTFWSHNAIDDAIKTIKKI